jgi:hypothetical protein
VAVAPFELQCVSAHRLDVLQHDQERYVIALDLPDPGPFVDASRTRAMQPKVADGIDAMMPVAPLDAEHTFVQPGQIFWFELGLSHVHWAFESQIEDRRSQISNFESRLPAHLKFEI